MRERTAIPFGQCAYPEGGNLYLTGAIRERF